MCSALSECRDILCFMGFKFFKHCLNLGWVFYSITKKCFLTKPVFRGGTIMGNLRNYGSSGKKALLKHTQQAKHMNMNMYMKIEMCCNFLICKN